MSSAQPLAAQLPLMLARSLNARIRSASRELASRLDASDRALWLAIFAPMLALYLATLRVNPANMITDTVSVTSSAWQLAHHGTPRLPIGDPHWDAWMIPSGHGYVVSNREPGLIGLAAIFYVITPTASIFDVAPASIAAALLTAAAVATLAVLARSLVSTRAAVMTGAIVGTATTTWAVSGTSLWPHGPDQLYLALAVLGLSRGKFGLAGMGFALAILTRPPLAIAAATVGVWHLVERRSLRPAILIGIPAVLASAGYLAYSHAFWGGGVQSQYTAATGTDDLGELSAVGPTAWVRFVVNVFGTLVSPGRGVVFGAPFLVMLAFGLRSAWRAAPGWARSAAVAGTLYMLFHLKAHRFQGGSPFWSYRYPIEALTLLVPLLVLAWREYVRLTRNRRALFAALVIASVALQATGATCFRSTSGNGSNVWGISDLHAALSDHPVAASVILIAGCALAVTAFWRTSACGSAMGEPNDASARPAAEIPLQCAATRSE